MALWLVRAGAHGEFEKKFLEENRIYLTWSGLSHDLAALKNRGQFRTLLEEVYPDAPKGKISNNLGQIWGFSKGIKPGDWVVLPSKLKPAVHVAEVKGDYTFNPDGDDSFFHYRDIEWIVQDVPRTNFDQAMFLIGACYEGSGINASETLNNENFKPHPALGAILTWFKTHGADSKVRNAAITAASLYQAWESRNQSKVKQLSLFDALGKEEA